LRSRRIYTGPLSLVTESTRQLASTSALSFLALKARLELLRYRFWLTSTHRACSLFSFTHGKSLISIAEVVRTIKRLLCGDESELAEEVSRRQRIEEWSDHMILTA
jgi:hypothetical protein